MCKYCKIREDDDNCGVYFLNSKPIESPIYPTYIELIMVHNNEKGFYLSAYINGFEGSIEARKRIKYCPMCGRKLNHPK